MRASVLALSIACNLALNAAPIEAQNTNTIRAHVERTTSPVLGAGRTVSPARMPGKILPLPVMFDTRVGHQYEGLNLPVPDNSLWFRYYKAGEQADLKHDVDTAKKYWMASLAELEKVAPNPSDDLMSVKLSALEIGLIGIYPKDWTTLDKSQPEKEQLSDEQVRVLYRIAVINSRLVPGDKLLCSKSNERYEIAKRERDKSTLDSKKRESR